MPPKFREVFIHAGSFLLFLAIPIVLAPESKTWLEHLHDPRVQRDLWGYFLAAIFFYLHYLVLIPKLLFKRKYAIYAAIVAMCFLLTALHPAGSPGPKRIHNSEQRDFRPAPPDFPRPPGPPNRFIGDLSHNVFRFSLVFFLSLVIRIEQRRRQADRDKLQAELSFLKAQINPHFLFNALNSIYSLAIEKSDDTAEAVVLLSGMMRYVTDESHQEYVSLSKEINYVKSYLALQKLRFGETVQLQEQITGDLAGATIAPQILIPFVENAFKYGVNPEERSVIKLRIEFREGVLQMWIQNNKVSVPAQSEVVTTLGLSNTRKRLELTYPGHHVLVINENSDTFTIDLSIHLK